MEQTLKIYFTSDVHGYFFPTTYGDLNRKDLGLFSFARDFKKDENTLVIDGGDILQGSAFAYYCRQKLGSPRTIADIMNDCGYDYYTLGNHDFNYGMDYQNAYKKAHHGVCVCQNLVDEAGSPCHPYVIRTLGNGLRVGIVGIVTDYVNVWERKENLVGIRITDPFEAAKEALLHLKKEADITLCIYHGGFECDLKTGERLQKTTENVGYRICRELDFDILLTGHQHMSVDGQYVHGTYVVQPLENAKEYHYLEAVRTKGGLTVRSEKRAADGADARGALCEKYAAEEAQVQNWLDQPIGHLSRALLPGEKADMALHGSPIADFLNRIQLHFSGAQLSAVGLANEIAGFRSKVSVRDIIATYPYPNTLIVCRISGKQLKQVMERSAEYFAVAADGTVQVAESFLVPKVEHYNYDYYMGAAYEIDPAAPVGNRIKHLAYDGKPVEETDSFTLCLNNYRYSGAGGYEVYTECKLVREINIEMVELILEYFKENPYVEV